MVVKESRRAADLSKIIIVTIFPQHCKLIIFLRPIPCCSHTPLSNGFVTLDTVHGEEFSLFKMDNVVVVEEPLELVDRVCATPSGSTG